MIAVPVKDYLQSTALLRKSFCDSFAKFCNSLIDLRWNPFFFLFNFAIILYEEENIVSRNVKSFDIFFLANGTFGQPRVFLEVKSSFLYLYHFYPLSRIVHRACRWRTVCGRFMDDFGTI